MLLRLFLLFTLVPLAELFLLLRIGALVGLGPTLLLVIATGFAGAWLARREGLRSWGAVQSELSAGRLPAEELFHSLLILVAGVVLVTPGVLTDLAGLLLLVRPLRSGLIGRMRRGLERRVASGEAAWGSGGRVFWWNAGSGPSRPSEPGSPELGSRRGPELEGGADEEGESRRRPRVIEL